MRLVKNKNWIVLLAVFVLVILGLSLNGTFASAQEGVASGCPDLRIWKNVYEWVDSDSSGNLTPGDIIRYEIVLWNFNWCVVARNVHFIDPIPEGTTALGDAVLLGVPGDGEIVSQDPLEIQGMTVQGGCLWGRLVKFSVQVNCPIDCGTMISNQGVADFVCGDQTIVVPSDDLNTPEPNDPTLFGPVVTRSLLSIGKAVAPVGNVSPGSKLDYTITINNGGCMNASGVVVEDSLPPNTTPVGNAASSSGTVVSQNPVRVEGMSVPKDTPQVVTYSVIVNSPLDYGTKIKNTAFVTYDPDGGACPLEPTTVESNEVTNTVVSSSSLNAVKSVSPVGQVTRTEKIDYTVTISNTGNMNAGGVTFEDEIPANTQAVGNAASTSGTVISQSPVKVTGITVPAGGNVVITFSVTVNDDAANGAVITNTGKVTYDPDGENGPVEETEILTNPVSNTVFVRKPPEPPPPPPPPKPKVSTHWYLAEGYTGKDLYYPGESFDTYILIQNATAKTAVVEATFMRERFTPIVQTYEISPRSRFTINLNEVPDCANHHISTRLISKNGVDIAVERAMYFNYGGLEGGHDSIGTSELSKTWYIPEGYTRDDSATGGVFDTYVLLSNPNNKKANVKVTFFREGNTPVEQEIAVEPLARHTIIVDEVPGCEDAHVSTRVVSDTPIVAERSEYFRYDDIEGGHCSIGAMSPSKEWYMPEGYTVDDPATGGRFDTYVLIENPQKEEANVKATYMRQDNTPVEVDYKIDPETRFTIRLDDVPGCEASSVATRLVSDVPIVAERVSYFNYDGIRDGHGSIAATAGERWFMPEGYTSDNPNTGERFDSYVLLMNPNEKNVEVQVTFMAPPFGDQTVEKTQKYILGPNSRFTIHVDEVEGFESSSFSTEVKSLVKGAPIICERAMYFRYSEEMIEGGHDSIGYDP